MQQTYVLFSAEMYAFLFRIYRGIDKHVDHTLDVHLHFLLCPFLDLLDKVDGPISARNAFHLCLEYSGTTSCMYMHVQWCFIVTFTSLYLRLDPH